jgi:hypothetical protein
MTIRLRYRNLEASRAVLGLAAAARGARYEVLFSDGRNGILMRGRQLVAATLVLILEDARYGNFVGRVFFGNRGVAGRAALSCDGGHGNNGGAARS